MKYGTNLENYMKAPNSKLPSRMRFVSQQFVKICTIIPYKVEMCKTSDLVISIPFYSVHDGFQWPPAMYNSWSQTLHHSSQVFGGELQFHVSGTLDTVPNGKCGILYREQKSQWYDPVVAYNGIFQYYVHWWVVATHTLWTLCLLCMVYTPPFKNQNKLQQSPGSETWTGMWQHQHWFL